MHFSHLVHSYFLKCLAGIPSQDVEVVRENKSSNDVERVVRACYHQNDTVVYIAERDEETQPIVPIFVELDRNGEHQTSVSTVEEIAHAVGHKNGRKVRIVPLVGARNSELKEGLSILGIST